MRALRTIYRYWLTLLFVAVIAQIAGAAYGAFYAALHGVGILHGINALVVLGLVGYLTARAWRARASMASPEPAPVIG